MAAPYIDDAFETAFDSDLHLNFEQGDSHFRGLMRTDGEVVGEKIRYQKLGGLEMQPVARYDEIPLSLPAHSHADAEMESHFVRTAIRAHDLTALSTNQRGGYAQKMANSANRKVDDIVVAALDAGGTTYTVGDYSTNITRSLALQLREQFDINEVPDDGMRCVAISPRAESHLMTIDEYRHADLISSSDLPYNSGTNHGRKYRRWAGFNWFNTNKLTGVTTATCKAYAWHFSAVGHGIASDITSDWQWINPRQHWSGVCSLQMGAVVIDPLGVVQLQLKDDQAIPS